MKTGLVIVTVLLTVGIGVATATTPAIETSPDRTEVSDPGDVCKNGSTGYYWTLEDRFEGDEAYRVLCEPIGCTGCDGGWKPISVTMNLYWENSNTCAMTVQAELREADLSVTGAPVPGRVIATSEPTRVGPFSPAGLWAVTVALPRDSEVVSGPCFASLTFLDKCDDLPALVAAPGACEPLRSWNDRGEGWVDMHALDLPGNLSAYASFECQTSTAREEQTVGWTTIKSMYRSDD